MVVVPSRSTDPQRDLGGEAGAAWTTFAGVSLVTGGGGVALAGTLGLGWVAGEGADDLAAAVSIEISVWPTLTSMPCLT
jgi:hypothetical protein